MKLQAQGIVKYYGHLKALDNVSFTLTECIYGLLGPNGAGKSTLMNILTGNLKQDAGTLLIDGKDVAKNFHTYHSALGYMPQSETLYGFQTGLQFMEYIALLKEMTRKDSEQEIRNLLMKVQLWDDRNKKIKTYSGGMKRRLMLAATMLNHPKILILDEPTAGLDPNQRIAVRNLIGEMSFSSIVILSTHVVSDIEYIASEIMIMDKGKILFQEKPYHLHNIAAGKVFEMTVKEEEIAELTKIGKISAITRVEEGISVRLISDHPVSVPHQLVKPTLEDVYQYLFREEAL